MYVRARVEGNVETLHHPPPSTLPVGGLPPVWRGLEADPFDILLAVCGHVPDARRAFAPSPDPLVIGECFAIRRAPRLEAMQQSGGALLQVRIQDTAFRQPPAVK